MIRTLFQRRSPLFVLALVALTTTAALVPGHAHAEWYDGFVKAIVSASLAPVALISWGILAFSKFVLWVAGILFNWSILVLVFQFSTYLGNSQGMILAWSLLRDLGNILLLFGFVSIGIQMILNVGHFSAGKALPPLIIFAVLLNFSLFAAEAVVDVSNGMSLALYDQSITAACVGDRSTCQIQNGLVGEFMGQGNVVTVIEKGDEMSQLSYFDDPLPYVLKYLMLAVMVMTMAVVFFAGALLLIARGITLAFLMVTSPIGFAGMAIPQLQDYAGRWWKALLDNALFAPVFIMLIFVSLRLSDGLRSLADQSGGLANALAGNGTLDTGAIFLFVMVVGFLVASLMAAKNFSIVGAEFAIGTATKLGTSGALPFRDMLGATSRRVGKAYDKSAFARTLRSAPLLNIAGKPLDDALKSTFAAGTNVKVPGWGSYADQRKANEARDKELKHGEHEAHQQHELDGALKDAKASGNADILEKTVNKMGVGDLKNMSQLKKGGEGAEQIAKVLSPSKFKQVLDDHDIDESVKGKMRNARFGELNSNLAAAAAPTATAADRAKLRQWPAADIATSGLLNDDTRRQELARTLSDKQFDSLVSNDEVGKNAKQHLRELRDGTGAGARFSRAHAASSLKGMEVADIAKLKSSVLATDQVRTALSIPAFAEIARTNKQFDSAIERASFVREIQDINLRPVGDSQKDALDDYLYLVAGMNAEKNFKRYYGLP